MRWTPNQIWGALLGLGLADLAENNSNACEDILHSLRLHQEAGGQLRQTSSLVGVARLGLHEGDAARAAQLLDAVESAPKALKAALEPEVIRFHAQTLAAVREQLGEQAFQSAFEKGSKWSLEEAVQGALAGAVWKPSPFLQGIKSASPVVQSTIVAQAVWVHPRIVRKRPPTNDLKRSSQQAEPRLFA